MGTSGAAETFYVVASTDLQRSGVMTARIREQLDRVADLKTKCSVTISAVPVEFPAAPAEATLEQQVQNVASCITQMILKSMDRKHPVAAKSTAIH